MFAVFIIGMAILAILAGSFSYALTIFDIILISIIAFTFYYFILGKRKVFLWFSLISLMTITGVGIYLYRNELLLSTLDKVLNYIEPYYYSVKVTEYYIGKDHQFLLILVLGFLLYKVIMMFYNSSKLGFVPPIFGALFILGAFIAGSFSSVTDHYAFLMFILATFIYYFDLYYNKTFASEGVRRRYSFYILGTTMAILVLVLASIANNTYDNPFKKKVKVAVVAPRDREDEVNDYDLDKLELIYPVSDEYKVSSNFEHRGIQVFKIRTEKLKYFKGQTFNVFNDGKWTNTKTNILSQDEVVNPILDSRIIADEEIFYNEEVEVIYQYVFTDSIISGPYTKEIVFDELISDINIYEDGMYKADDMVGINFTYTLDVAVPKYRTKALISYLETLEGDNTDLSDYLNVPDGYADLTKLAYDITKDYEHDIEKAIAIEHYLKTTLKYSEEPEFRTDKEMINEFLFVTQEGFCQQFATTMALMLRSVDIPSRFVTGYVISSSEMDFEDLPEELLYRDQIDFEPYKNVYDNDAHTWVEIYVPSFGWIQFEPTPGRSAIQFSDPREFEYDPVDVTKPSTIHTIVTHQYFAPSIGTIIFLIIAMIIIMFIRRGYILKKNIKRRLVTNYKLILVYLKALKLEKEGHETLREYSKRIDKRLTNVQGEFKDCVPFLEKAFYNDVEPSLEDINTIESFLNEVKFNVKRMVVPLTYRRLRFIEIVLLHK